MKLQQSVSSVVKLHYDKAGYIKPILYTRKCAVTCFFAVLHQTLLKIFIHKPPTTSLIISLG